MKNAITDNECDTASRGRIGGSRCGAHYFDVMQFKRQRISTIQCDYKDIDVM